MNKRLYIYFGGSPKGLRIRRLSEAGEKLGYEVILVEFSDLILTESGVTIGDKLLEVVPDDISWICGNSMIAHEIARIYKRRGWRIWPSAGAIPYSDKYWTANFFAEAGVATPKTVYLDLKTPQPGIDYVGGFPCVIKRIHSSEGKHVELVNSLTEIEEFVGKGYGKAAKGKRKIVRMSFILQEFISESSGTDYRVTFLDGQIVGFFKRTAKEGFKANLSLGGVGEHLEESKELRELSNIIIQKSGLFFGGIDFIKSNRGYLAIEINTSAQFEKFEEYLKRDIAGEILAGLIKQR